jgi:hypothetical protein
MKRKLSHRFLLSCSTLALAAGCSQIVGISDYEIDPKLDGAVGGEAGTGNTGAGGAGDAKNDAGSPNGGQPPSDGGAPEPGTAGSPTTGNAGAAGASPGTVVPCDSEDCCTALGGNPVGVELLKDGGFELGPIGDGDSPWTQLSTNDVEIITSNPDYGFDPKSGSYYAYLSGIAGERSTLYTETITVPSDAGWLVVSGYRLFQIDVEDDPNEDFCGVGFYEVPPAMALEIPFYWSSTANSTDGWGDTPTWKRFEASWDAAPHQGTKRRVGLVAESDKYPDKADVAADDLTSSSYLFDDVSLKAFRCYE